MRSPANEALRLIPASLREDSLGSNSACSQGVSPPWGGSLLCVLAGRLFTFSTPGLGTFEALYLSSNLEQPFKYTGSLSPFFQLRKPSLGEVRLGQVSKSAVPTPSLGLEPPLWTGPQLSYLQGLPRALLFAYIRGPLLLSQRPEFPALRQVKSRSPTPKAPKFSVKSKHRLGHNQAWPYCEQVIF